MNISMRTIPVATASAKYSVFIQPGLLDKLGARIAAVAGKQRSIFVVTSPEIWTLWGKPFLAAFSARDIRIHTLFVPAGERYKRLATVERLAEEMSRAGAKAYLVTRPHNVNNIWEPSVKDIAQFADIILGR